AGGGGAGTGRHAGGTAIVGAVGTRRGGSPADPRGESGAGTPGPAAPRGQVSRATPIELPTVVLTPTWLGIRFVVRALARGRSPHGLKPALQTMTKWGTYRSLNSGNRDHAMRTEPGFPGSPSHTMSRSTKRRTTSTLVTRWEVTSATLKADVPFASARGKTS